MKWEPIETAPRDGSRVLVWGEHDGIQLAKWIPEGYWRGEDWLYGPTHWMPLPDPPGEE